MRRRPPPHKWIRRRLERILAFALLKPEQRSYVKLIKEHEGLDREYYLKVHSNSFHSIFRFAPERHYVVFGEPGQLSPNPNFSPGGYFRENDEARSSGMQPFEHYLSFGRQEGLQTFDQLSFEPLPAPPDRAPTRAAIVLHLFYEDLWDEFQASLTQLGEACDLFVILTKNASDTPETRRLILADQPDAIVIGLPNHGRDIYPFLHLINHGLLDPYEAVCKIHSKKSPHREDGSNWRTDAVTALLPTELTELLEAFLSDETTSVMTAPGLSYSDQYWWRINKARTHELLQRIDLDTPDRLAPFPAGSMYWADARIIQQLKALDLRPDDFEREAGQVDGTTAHAVERLIGFLATAVDKPVVETPHHTTS